MAIAEKMIAEAVSKNAECSRGVENHVLAVFKPVVSPDIRFRWFAGPEFGAKHYRIRNFSEAFKKIDGIWQVFEEFESRNGYVIGVE